MTALEAFKAEALSDAVRERLAAMREAAELADAAQAHFRHREGAVPDHDPELAGSGVLARGSDPMKPR